MLYTYASVNPHVGLDAILHVHHEVGIVERDTHGLLGAVGRTAPAATTLIVVHRDVVLDGDRAEDTVFETGAAPHAIVGHLDREAFDGRYDLVELRRRYVLVETQFCQ